MKLSPTLSRLLNDSNSIDTIEINNDEVSLLSLEIENEQKELSNNINTADEISSAVSDIEIAKDVIEAGLQSDVNMDTAKILISNLNNAIGKLSIKHKKEVAGLQSDNPQNLLTAGLLAADSILSKAKEALLKIWENIKKGFKWFVSKIKEMIAAIFSPFKKILKKQRSNRFSIVTLKEAEDFLNKNKAELESDDEETISKLKDNFIKKLKETAPMAYGINIDEAKKEVDEFISASGFLGNNASFVNFMSNLFVIKKKVDSSLNIKVGSNDKSGTFYFPISRSIYEFSIIEMIAENKNNESIVDFLKDNGATNISEITSDLSTSDKMEKAFESAINKKLDDISKTGLSAIIAGDAVNYVNKIPIMIDKVIEVYKDIGAVLQKIGQNGDENDIAISSLGLKSDSFVYVNSEKSVLSMTKLIDISYVNLFSTGSIAIRNQPVNVSLSFDQLASGIKGGERSVSDNEIYKKIQDSINKLEKSYDETMKEINKAIHGKEFTSYHKANKVLHLLISNFGKLSPIKSIKYFQNVSTSYKNILDVFDIQHLIKEEFNNLESYK